MRKLLKAIGLTFYSEFEKECQTNVELVRHVSDLGDQVIALRREMQIQAEHHKKIEEIKIAQVNLTISTENDKLQAKVAQMAKEMNDLQHRYAVAKLEIQQAQTDIDLAAENAELKERLAEMAAHHKRTTAGVKTLVTFIHRTHRLNLPFINGTIRNALSKANGS